MNKNISDINTQGLVDSLETLAQACKSAVDSLVALGNVNNVCTDAFVSDRAKAQKVAKLRRDVAALRLQVEQQITNKK